MYEQEQIAKATNEIDTHVNGDRGTITITQEEYNDLKTLIKPKELSLDLEISTTNLYVNEVYMQGAEVVINLSADVTTAIERGSTLIANLPEGYYPIKNTISAIYMYSASATQAGTFKVTTDGKLYVGNWSSSSITQFSGQIRYRYK